MSTTRRFGRTDRTCRLGSKLLAGFFPCAFRADNCQQAPSNILTGELNCELIALAPKSLIIGNSKVTLCQDQGAPDLLEEGQHEIRLNSSFMHLPQVSLLLKWKL